MEKECMNRESRHHPPSFLHSLECMERQRETKELEQPTEQDMHYLCRDDEEGKAGEDDDDERREENVEKNEGKKETKEWNGEWEREREKMRKAT